MGNGKGNGKGSEGGGVDVSVSAGMSLEVGRRGRKANGLTEDSKVVMRKGKGRDEVDGAGDPVATGWGVGDGDKGWGRIEAKKRRNIYSQNRVVTRSQHEPKRTETQTQTTT